MRGLAQLNTALDKLSREEATKAGQAANRAGAAVIAKAAKQEAPVGPSAQGERRNRRRKDGSVREEAHAKITNSIKVRKTRSETATKVVNTVTTGAAYHAHMVEFGSIHNAPDPFMRRAVDNNQQEAIEAVKKALAKQIVRRSR